MELKEKQTAESFVRYLVVMSFRLIFDNWIWQLFGFKKRPKRGAKFDIFINHNRLKVETFLRRAFVITCIAVGQNALKSANSLAIRKKIIIRALDLIASFEGVINAFKFQSKNDFFLYFSNNLQPYFNAKCAWCSNQSHVFNRYNTLVL